MINGTSFGVEHVSRYRIEADVTAAASLGNVLIQPTYRTAGNKPVLMSALHSFMGVGGPICEIEPWSGWSTEGGTRGQIIQGHEEEQKRRRALNNRF